VFPPRGPEETSISCDSSLARNGGVEGDTQIMHTHYERQIRSCSCLSRRMTRRSVAVHYESYSSTKDEKDEILHDELHELLVLVVGTRVVNKVQF
jgi:hypothetical protein